MKPQISAVVVTSYFVSVWCSSELNAVDFEQEIAPILEQKCMGCHNPNRLEGDFSMATFGEMQAAGEDLLIPGNPDDSMLHWITLPLEDGKPPEMPEEGEPLSSEESELLAKSQLIT